jgi:ribose-phosphate pyrophosphokinase
MTQHSLTLFALEGSRHFGQLVADRLAVPLAPHEERAFEDGEHKARPLQSVRGHNTFVIHSLHGDDRQSTNDKLCRLLFFCAALRDAGASSVSAVVPYLCYARKDRRTKAFDPITTRYVAALFEAVCIDRVIAVEVHNVAAFDNAFRCPTVHIECAPLFAAQFAPICRGRSVVAVSPDAGGMKRQDRFRQELQTLTGQEVGSALMEKTRSGGVVAGDLLAGDVRDSVTIIVDDLISTDGTLLRAAKACRAAGATKVFAAAAHGLFVGGASELVDASAIDQIVVGNAVPPFRLSPEAVRQRIDIIDLSDAVAAAIESSRDGG